ncbi:MAG: DUF368 domain-containing protein [Planctomycetota bacterium]|nr:DUF368 domain-containing protein [Planctomycetota bacterium]
MIKQLVLVVKGVFVGIANVIPGVSGGTVALILGIFEDIVVALKKFNLRYLFPLGIGLGIAFVGASKLIPALMDRYPSELAAVFIGLILGSIRTPYREMKRHGWEECLCLVAGLVAGFLLVWFVPEESKSAVAGLSMPAPSVPSFLWYAACGLLATSVMILPGVSGSATLVLIGEYKTVWTAVGTVVSKFMPSFLDVKLGDAKPAPFVDSLVVCTAFGIGAILCFIFFIRLLDLLLKRYRSQTMALLIGLMLGALPGVWPPKGQGRVSVPVFLLLAGGLGLALLSEFLSAKKEKVKAALEAAQTGAGGSKPPDPK